MTIAYEVILPLHLTFKTNYIEDLVFLRQRICNIFAVNDLP